MRLKIEWSEKDMARLKKCRDLARFLHFYILAKKIDKKISEIKLKLHSGRYKYD